MMDGESGVVIVMQSPVEQDEPHNFAL